MNIKMIQSIEIENIPESLKLWDQLPNNGGNVVYVDKDSDFGEFLLNNGYIFEKDWICLVVFR